MNVNEQWQESSYYNNVLPVCWWQGRCLETKSTSADTRLVRGLLQQHTQQFIGDNKRDGGAAQFVPRPLQEGHFRSQEVNQKVCVQNNVEALLIHELSRGTDSDATPSWWVKASAPLWLLAIPGLESKASPTSMAAGEKGLYLPRPRPAATAVRSSFFVFPFSPFFVRGSIHLVWVHKQCRQAQSVCPQSRLLPWSQMMEMVQLAFSL